MSTILATLLGVFLILLVLLDGFETIVLPRRATQRILLSRHFYRLTWLPWKAVGKRIVRNLQARETFLSLYASFSLILLIVVWVVLLTLGFGLLQWSIGGNMRLPDGTISNGDFGTAIYLSLTSFSTLGLGDVLPLDFMGRALAVTEAGTGFAFLATIISYLPALNTAFSQREVRVSLLDERAGSPPSAIELIRRHTLHNDLSGINGIMAEWERWSAELLESHLSYPVLGYFRSQHDNQSWVAALTTILDAAALVIVGVEEVPKRQAQLTFAMARHAAVDLTQVYNTPPERPDPDRLPPEELSLLRTTLDADGARLASDEAADRQLADLRKMYEPYMTALARHLLMPLPSWLPPAGVPDAWQTTSWE